MFSKIAVSISFSSSPTLCKYKLSNLLPLHTSPLLPPTSNAKPIRLTIPRTNSKNDSPPLHPGIILAKSNTSTSLFKHTNSVRHKLELKDTRRTTILARGDTARTKCRSSNLRIRRTVHMEPRADCIAMRIEQGHTVEFIAQDLLWVVGEAGGEFHEGFVELGLEGVF